MSEPKIPGGYIVIARQIVESEIWNKPPLYIKVWVYLLSQAQHSEYKRLKRGQLSTSIPEIIEACSWHIGYRKVKPTKDQIYQIIDWLRKPRESVHERQTKATMITTTKATQGLLITIENYSFYQDSANYESNKESNNENDMKATSKQRQANNINKNGKNGKNGKNNIFLSDSIEYRLADYLRKYIIRNNTNAKVPDDTKIQNWCKTIDLMIRIDKRTSNDIKDHIHFSQTDTFWMSNILSAASLRKQYDQLTMKMKIPTLQKPKDKQKQIQPKCKTV